MKQTNLDIGNRIKYYREALGMTQEELALKVGYVNKSSIYSIEKGMAAVPYDKLSAIATALGVSEQTLLYGENFSMVDYMLQTNPAANEDMIIFTPKMLEQLPYGEYKRLKAYHDKLLEALKDDEE